MKKIFAMFGLLMFGLCFLFFVTSNSNVSADQAQYGDNYVIYSIEGEYLFEKQDACVGDEYIDSKLNCYVVVEINEQTKTGKAKFVKKYSLPKVVQKQHEQAVSNSNCRGTVGLYLTHNDESYITGDGVDSVYGPGGVHDVAKLLQISLQAQNINALLDETLHISHDVNAYSRSNSTAKKLLNSGADAIFDIHRDATSRAYYVTKVNGEDFCRVRMVVGKANPNYEQNKAFALFLMSVAKTYCPHLFVDIYMAKGHYNQALSSYAMLFEFGSHLVEKSLVLKTVPHLAEVLTIALYGELVALEQGEQEHPNTIQEDNTNNNLELNHKNNQEDVIQNEFVKEKVTQNNANTANTTDSGSGEFVTINKNVVNGTNGYLSIILIALCLIILAAFAIKNRKNKH